MYYIRRFTSRQDGNVEVGNDISHWKSIRMFTSLSEGKVVRLLCTGLLMKWPEMNLETSRLIHGLSETPNTER